ncbi:MAG: D-2-hydroxyacid dehydrogenase [Betaproteobacteria bacterium]|jgi:phosphoglycerate dehydrogenase-like enzyme|nr:D-2-hydroxyacid dehydrogenase [Betaproteobacteria bacterium]
MTHHVVAALPTEARPYLEHQLPTGVEARWFNGKAQALVAGKGATVGWFDIGHRDDFADAVRNATDLKWLFTKLAGVDGLPLEELAARKIVFTNCPGLAAPTVSEYVLLGMLSIAKGYREIIKAEMKHEWLTIPPGKVELMGSSALIVGYGSIGRMIEERLKAFGVTVSVVRRTPVSGEHAIGPTQWRARLGEFDWIILTAPATTETTRMIGAAELSAMKKTAVLVNVARGSLVDQDALVTALVQRDIAAAFLDVTEPEPLPADHPLWSLENAHITMHLSGRSRTHEMPLTAKRFLENLHLYCEGKPLLYQVDLQLGY